MGGRTSHSVLQNFSWGWWVSQRICSGAARHALPVGSDTATHTWSLTQRVMRVQIDTCKESRGVDSLACALLEWVAQPCSSTLSSFPSAPRDACGTPICKEFSAMWESKNTLRSPRLNPRHCRCPAFHRLHTEAEYSPPLGGRGCLHLYSTALYLLGDFSGLLCEYRDNVLLAPGKALVSPVGFLRGLFSWQAGTDGRGRNSLFLTWQELVSCSLGAIACVEWDVTLVSVSSTTGLEKAHFPIPQHCQTISPWIHLQARTLSWFMPPQRSVKITILEDHNSSHLNFNY